MVSLKQQPPDKLRASSGWKLGGGVVWLFFLCLQAAPANGIYRNGVGAQSMSLGGTGTAWAADPLGALAANPAGLGFLKTPELSLGFFGASAQGTFSKAPNSTGSLNDSPNAWPEAALAIPLGKSPVTLGLSFIPEAGALVDWNFADPPGGLGGTVSYGVQRHKSEIAVLRSALGLGVQINPRFSVGASAGLIYNRNVLQTPYTFQNLSGGPTYNGAKTLLDLQTSGFGWNVQVGLLYRPLTNLQFGLAYESEARVNSSGTATGDPYAQFGAAPGALAFRYDASVRNIFPQQASAGLSWQPQSRWRVALQVDWINWGDSFETLPVSLKNGNNATVNSVLGAGFSDAIPLNWQDQLVYRAGLEYAVTEMIFLRGGYAYGKSPVPDATLTPMTAAIMEHTLTAGIGCRWRRLEFDLAYQYDLPVRRTVGTSGLRAGEYANASTRVNLHWLALTTHIHF